MQAGRGSKSHENRLVAVKGTPAHPHPHPHPYYRRLCTQYVGKTVLSVTPSMLGVRTAASLAQFTAATMV